MRLFFRVLWIGLILLVSSIAWMLLAGTMNARTNAQSGELYGQVADLWGQPQEQRAPMLGFRWLEPVERSERVRDPITGRIEDKTRMELVEHQERAFLGATVIDTGLSLDLRRKGLMWFPLYDVDFQATYTYTHSHAQVGSLDFTFPFPSNSGLYDGFHLEVDGVAPTGLQPTNGAVSVSIPVEPGQVVAVTVGYRSRGMDSWTYVPSDSVETLRDFTVHMRTDFEEIDFPAFSVSPTDRSREGEGWALTWRFDQVVTGHHVGMVMPHRVQPGELAQEMAISAPISLLFFFLVVFVIGELEGIDLHPVHLALVAGAFFAFHLLFSYTADRLPIELAFALASVVSLLLVVSYLRLVVSDRFAFGPAAAAQLVYLVGFGLAHFWEGFTGITVTVLSILTLFVIMQLTARVDWRRKGQGAT